MWNFGASNYYSVVELVDNLNHSDVLEMFGEEMQLIEMLINYYETNHDVHHSDRKVQRLKILKKLLHQHHVVMAMARMLRYAEPVQRDHGDAEQSFLNS
jgi:hypothetical protein